MIWWKFSLTGCPNAICCRPAEMRIPQDAGCSSLLARSTSLRATLVFNRWQECVRCTEIGRALIFDILVSDSQARQVSAVIDCRYRSGFEMILSQRKLNCALYVRAPKQFGVACS
jgi:hypothetical protein